MAGRRAAAHAGHRDVGRGTARAGAARLVQPAHARPGSRRARPRPRHPAPGARGNAAAAVSPQRRHLRVAAARRRRSPPALRRGRPLLRPLPPARLSRGRRCPDIASRPGAARLRHRDRTARHRGGVAAPHRRRVGQRPLERGRRDPARRVRRRAFAAQHRAAACAGGSGGSLDGDPCLHAAHRRDPRRDRQQCRDRQAVRRRSGRVAAGRAAGRRPHDGRRGHTRRPSPAREGSAGARVCGLGPRHRRARHRDPCRGRRHAAHPGCRARSVDGADDDRGRRRRAGRHPRPDHRTRPCPRPRATPAAVGGRHGRRRRTRDSPSAAGRQCAGPGQPRGPAPAGDRRTAGSRPRRRPRPPGIATRCPGR